MENQNQKEALQIESGVLGANKLKEVNGQYLFNANKTVTRGEMKKLMKLGFSHMYRSGNGVALFFDKINDQKPKLPSPMQTLTGDFKPH
ncbi:hypothetical protein [Nonlabens dokdonensis]|uniref:hypothetical protein n=1 Tax=Nonlabens dokdonensis TaxID=328515 RepID=UPI0026EBB5A2|nr:hypothetical protein [Nonlabens dokdonensis]